jgi:hypothetical protein
MLEQCPLYSIETTQSLAEVFIENGLIVDAKNFSEIGKTKKFYRRVELKTTRTVEIPSPPIKKVQKCVHDTFMLLRKHLPPYVMTFHSPVENARKHIKYKQTATLDISKFFPSTKSSIIRRFLENDLKCSKGIANLLTNLLTYKGHLPTGAPSSPIVGYFAHTRMWEQINAACEKNGYLFTLYMDDLTISGDKVHGKLLWKIKQILFANGFKVNKKKERCFRPNSARQVTGVIISKDGTLKLSSSDHLKRFELYKEFSKCPFPEVKKIKLSQRIEGLNAWQRHIESIRKEEPFVSIESK